MDPISRLFFLLSFTLSLTFQAHQAFGKGATGIKLITKTCEHSLYKELCVSSLKSAPGSQTADLNGLALIALNLAASNASDTSQHINQFLETETDPYVQQCLNDCSENYLDAIEQIDDSLAALDSKGYNDVNTWVTAAMSDAESCEQGFKDGASHVSVLHDKNAIFGQLCSNALAITNLLAGV